MRVGCAAVALAWLVASAVAHGDEGEVDRLSSIPDADKATAKLRVASGDEKFRAGDYAGALEDYRAADTIMGVPTTTFEVGRTLVVLQRYREARAALERVLAYPARDPEPDAFRRARQRASVALDDLKTKEPTITVRVRFSEGASDAVDVSVGGRSVEVGAATAVDPGEHQISVHAAGYVDQKRTLTVASATHPEVVVTLEPIAEDEPPLPPPQPDLPVTEPAPSVWPIVTWVGVGVAGAGVVVGSVMGGLSLSKASDFDAQRRADGTYPESARDLQAETLRFAHVSTVSFAVAGAGAALAVLGLVMIVTDDGAAEVSLSPAGLSLRGAF